MRFVNYPEQKQKPSHNKKNKHWEEKPANLWSLSQNPGGCVNYGSFGQPRHITTETRIKHQLQNNIPISGSNIKKTLTKKQ